MIKNTLKNLVLLFVISSFIISITSANDFENFQDNQLAAKYSFQSFSEKCTEDSQCDTIQICNSSGNCQRKQIFPLSFGEIFGSLMIILILGFGQAAGVGGGTSIMPILLALFLYDTKKSVAIVIVLVFSGSLGNVLQLTRDKTHDNVPVIDYRLILITLPSLIVGTVYGVAINKFLPPLLVCILLVILLMQQISKSYIRFKSMKDKEDQIKISSNSTILSAKIQINNSKCASQLTQSAFKSPFQTGDSLTLSIPLLDLNVKSGTTDRVENLDIIEQQQKELSELVKQEYEQFPKKQIFEIATISIFVVVFSLARGGSKFHSLIGIPPCGLIYQGMNLLLAFILYKWIMSIVKAISKVEKRKEELGYSFPNGKLSFEAIKKYAETGIIAGGIGGMLGIGGGIILIPRWLEYGIPSARTTACTLTIICFTTFNSFFQLYLSGSYTIEEILFFSALALLSSFICRAIKGYVKQTKKDSILVLILVVFMIMASTLLSGIIIYHAIQDFDDSTSFGRFC